jgi:glycosyltransferase involved in cell wall biosynthesis
MNVLHVIHCYFPAVGGTEFLFQRVSEELVSKYGDHVTVFTTYGYNAAIFVDPSQPTIPHTENEEVNGVRVHRFPINNRFPQRIQRLQARAYYGNWPLNDVIRSIYHGPISWPMFKAIASAQTDVVVASSFPYQHMYYAVLGKRFHRRPVVFHGALHPEDRWCYDRRTIFWAIAACDMYLANTTYEQDYVIAKGIAPEKVRIASPGVDPEPFMAADGTALRQKFNWPDNPIIAYVGQQSAHKGIETLYQAMPLVWQQLPEARLIVAGGRTPYSAKLDRILGAFSPQDRDRIQVLTNFAEEQKAQIFAACDLFVSASGFESFGITFIEAWAAGKPVIGCRSGAIPTVISEGQDGLLVPYQDERELARAVLDLLSDGALRERMGQQGREKVLDNYTWDTAVARFRQAYQDAIDMGA